MYILYFAMSGIHFYVMYLKFHSVVFYTYKIYYTLSTGVISAKNRTMYSIWKYRPALLWYDTSYLTVVRSPSDYWASLFYVVTARQHGLDYVVRCNNSHLSTFVLPLAFGRRRPAWGPGRYARLSTFYIHLSLVYIEMPVPYKESCEVVVYLTTVTIHPFHDVAG